MKISSSAFKNGEPIPRRYSREGGDVSPPLQIEEVPAETESLVLIMDDPDAPRGTFTHWILFDLDPQTTVIQEDGVPENARAGKSDWGEAGYGGPRPPSGVHRYFFKLFALDRKLNLPHGSARQEIEKAMSGHVLARAEHVGRFAAPQEAGVGKE